MKELTPEAKNQLPIYQEKWTNIALSTERINQDEATKAVIATYKVLGNPTPNIIFFPSPYAALETLKSLSKQEEKIDLTMIGIKFMEGIAKQLNKSVCLELFENLYVSKAADNLHRHVISFLRNLESDTTESNYLDNCLTPESRCGAFSIYDFCNSVLNCVIDEEKWLAFKSLIMSCGWVIPFQKTCLICDHPIKLSVDNEGNFHSEGEPCIEFYDGFSCYAYHGYNLPEKYGKIQPKNWPSQWILTESNDYLRQLFITTIGGVRICEELPKTELDSWHKYTLIRIEIDPDIDIKPLHFLRMNDSDSDNVKAIKVTHKIKSVKAAVEWLKSMKIDHETFQIIDPNFQSHFYMAGRYSILD